MLYHSARGSETYTIVGTPTIVDGVVSGFSGSDYLQINSQAIVPDTLEFGGKFTMGPSGKGGFIFHNFSVSNGIGLAVRPTSSSNQGMLLYAGTSHYVFYTHRFEAGTTHTYKVLYNKSAGICYLYVDDELRMTLDTSEYTVYFGDTLYIGRYGTDWFGGSIDLNETYIKVNGQPWFGICPIEVKKHQLMGPNGYTVVGSPTITDGVASGFSDSKYLTVSPVFPDLNGKNIEAVLNVAKVAATSAGARAMFWSHSFTIDVTNGNALRARIWTKKTGENSYTERSLFNYGFSIAGDSPKFYKFSKDGQTLSLEGSNDGETYTSGHTYVLEEGEELRVATAILLFKSDNWANISAELFLNNTYIKVNGKLWFWQPQETKRIVVNGVEVWTKPE